MIYIHKGDDTDFNGLPFLRFEINTEQDLTGWKAVFVLHTITKQIDDISSKSFDIHFSKEETKWLPCKQLNNELKLIDEEGKIKTIGKNIEICATQDIVENENCVVNLPILKDEGIEVNVSLLGVPTKLSQLDNDCNYLSVTITDPTENQIIKFDGEKWINARQTGGGTGGSGTFYHDELENRNLANQHKISAITNLQETLDGKAEKSEIPTLEGYATESFVAQEIGKIPNVDLSEYVTNTELESKGYLTEHQDISNLAAKNEIPTKTSQLTNDSSFATESFVTNKIAEAELGGGEVDLSGLATKDELNKKADKTELHTHSNKAVLDGITAQNITNWNNKSSFSGSYNDLSNKPTIPTKVSELTNDSGYLTQHQDISNLATKEELEAKQNTLVSGTSIKTINNQSILGSGNITIEGGGGGNVGTGLEGKITNCLTEIPQRIKYTLNNGTLTLKAGSVVIFPYGTENLTSQYPKGATFLNENLKVYDTQFTDNKFFVWAELQNDISGAPTTSDTKLGFIRVFFFSQDNEIKLERSVSTLSLSTIGTQSALIYNTTKNKIAYHSSGKPSNDIDIDAFPIGICKSNGTYKFGAVAQTFDGIGYIGSIVWADKGIKGLAPNGKNEDGTLSNIEFITDKLNVSTISADKHLCLNEAGIATYNNAEYDEKQNALITNNGIKNSVYVGQVKWSDRITSLISTKTFRAVDYNQIDGQWVMKEFAVMSSFPKSQQDFDLSDYLPNDGHNYEVMVSAYGATSATSGSLINVFIGSDLIDCEVCLFSATTRSSSNVTGGGTAIIPARNKLTVSNTGSVSSGNNSLKLLAYRRMGINS